MHRSTTRRALTGALALALVIGACSRHDDTSSPDSTSRPTTPPTTATPPTTVMTTAPSTADLPVTTPSSAPTTEPTSAVTADPGPRMPDVVGLGLQDAQDLIQRNGVFFSRSFDCTGAGRRQILDRNWVVVTQTPAPGAPFGEGEALLGAVKLDEPRTCV